MIQEDFSVAYFTKIHNDPSYQLPKINGANDCHLASWRIRHVVIDDYRKLKVDVVVVSTGGAIIKNVMKVYYIDQKVKCMTHTHA
jgi:hypothetical protein